MDCACPTCRHSCTQTPGIFHPDQIAPLAEKLGLSEQELFDRHLSVAFVHIGQFSGVRKIQYLEPRTVNGGKSAGHRGTHGRCHWLSSFGLCEIHDMGKPMECRESSHDPNYKSVWPQILAAWDSPEQQERISNLGTP